MSTLDIVKNKLWFLVADYGFEFCYGDGRGEHFYFSNKNGHIEFYEWDQFKEFEIRVSTGTYWEAIDLSQRYSKFWDEFNQKHKGIKWWFKDKRHDFWEMIVNIIKTDIATENTVFGLMLVK